MKPINFKKSFYVFQKNLKKDAPAILIFLGITGMVTAAITAVSATPKAMKLIKDAKKEKMIQNDKESAEDIELTAVEKVKAAWRPYVFPTVLGMASAGFLIASGSISIKRNAAMVASYKLVEKTLDEYKHQIIEDYGENKHDAIRNKIAKKRVDEHPIMDDYEIVDTKKGKTLCMDSLSGRYFLSNIDDIRRAQNTINNEMIHEMFSSLNEFYDEIGLSHTSIGNMLGWCIEDGMLDIYFSSQITDKNEPCIVIEYSRMPTPEF